MVAAGVPPEQMPGSTDDVEKLAALATAVIDVELKARFVALAESYLADARSQNAPTGATP